jgi:hypothetical protein
MANRSRCLSYTADELVRKLPGWKPAPVAATADGEAPGETVDMNATMREPILPKFSISDKFDLISKNETDSVRQQNLDEIMNIRDYLARPHIKRDEKDKTYINIPHMKTFESAILLPEEV